MMQFGLLYECQRPFQGTTLDWNALYKETLAQCELADQVGFNNLWFVEHHFLTGFSGSPSQDALFGALSRITKQIRIGYGVCALKRKVGMWLIHLGYTGTRRAFGHKRRAPLYAVRNVS
jgi:hypothetical protein